MVLNKQRVIYDLENCVLAEYFAHELITESKFSFASKDDIKDVCAKFKKFKQAFEDNDDDVYKKYTHEEIEMFEKYFDLDDKELKQKVEVALNNLHFEKTMADLSKTLDRFQAMCTASCISKEEGQKMATSLLAKVLIEQGLTDGYVKKMVPGIKSVEEMTQALAEKKISMTQLNQISLLFSQNNKTFDFENLQKSLTLDFMAYNDSSVINENIHSCSDSIREIVKNYVARVEITRKQDKDVDLMYESRSRAGADGGVKRKMNKLMGIMLAAGSSNGSAEAEYKQYVRFWKDMYGDEKGEGEIDKTLAVSQNSENKEKERFQKFVLKSEELYANALAAVLTQKYEQLAKNKDMAFDIGVYVQNFDKYIQSLKQGKNNLLILSFAKSDDDQDYLGNISEYRLRQQKIDEVNAQKIITYHHNTLTISGVIDFFKKFGPEKWKGLSEAQKADLVDQTVNHIGHGVVAIGVHAHQSKEPKNGLIDLSKTTKDDAILVGDIDFNALKDVSKKYPTLREKFKKYVKGYKAYLDSDSKSGPSKVVCQVGLPRTISENVSKVYTSLVKRLYKYNQMSLSRQAEQTL